MATSAERNLGKYYMKMGGGGILEKLQKTRRGEWKSRKSYAQIVIIITLIPF